jgi:hypothetical protein
VKCIFYFCNLVCTIKNLSIYLSIFCILIMIIGRLRYIEEQNKSNVD